MQNVWETVELSFWDLKSLLGTGLSDLKCMHTWSESIFWHKNNFSCFFIPPATVQSYNNIFIVQDRAFSEGFELCFMNQPEVPEDSRQFSQWQLGDNVAPRKGMRLLLVASSANSKIRNKDRMYWPDTFNPHKSVHREPHERLGTCTYNGSIVRVMPKTATELGGNVACLMCSSRYSMATVILIS
jgi:hypothetical protein